PPHTGLGSQKSPMITRFAKRHHPPMRPSMSEPARTFGAAIALRRVMEPSSGLPIFWVEGELPELPFAPDARVALVFDGRITFWHPLRPRKPAGSAFELLVLDEPGVHRVAVVLRSGGATHVLHERTFKSMTAAVNGRSMR